MSSNIVHRLATTILGVMALLVLTSGCASPSAEDAIVSKAQTEQELIALTQAVLQAQVTMIIYEAKESLFSQIHGLEVHFKDRSIGHTAKPSDGTVAQYLTTHGVAPQQLPEIEVKSGNRWGMSFSQWSIVVMTMLGIFSLLFFAWLPASLYEGLRYKIYRSGSMANRLLIAWVSLLVSGLVLFLLPDSFQLSTVSIGQVVRDVQAGVVAQLDYRAYVGYIEVHYYGFGTRYAYLEPNTASLKDYLIISGVAEEQLPQFSDNVPDMLVILFFSPITIGSFMLCLYTLRYVWQRWGKRPHRKAKDALA